MKFLDSIARKLLSHDCRMTPGQPIDSRQRKIGSIDRGSGQPVNSVNERLHRLIEVRDDLSTVNKSLVKLVEAQDKQTRAVNERLDKVIELLRATTLDKGNQPRDVNNTTAYSLGTQIIYLPFHPRERSNICRKCVRILR